MKILLSALLLLFSTQAFSQQEELTLSSRLEEDNTYIIEAKLNTPGTYSIAIFFTVVENFTTPSIYFTSISSNSQVLRLKPTDPNKGVEINFTYTYIKGHTASKPDVSFVYQLPFSPAKQRLVQYINRLSKTYESEKPEENWHKFSFEMEKGDTIRAIRKGVVVEIVDQYLPTEYKTYVSYTTQSNRMIVEHLDGTICEYTALEKGSFMVKVGDVIFPGDPIAKAGTYNNQDYNVRLWIHYIKENRRAANYNNAFERIDIDPLFATTRGDIKLINREKYTAVSLSDQIKQKEMTKKEKKSLSK